MSRLPPDGCLVPTEPLATLVRSFLERWNRDRPQTAGQFGDEVTPVRGVAWLASCADVPEATIQNIIDRRYRMTEFRTADRLIAALDVPQAWCDGTIQVFPNPSASASARAECCGGSTPVAA